MRIRYCFLLCVALLFLSGCALISPRPFSPIRTEYPAGMAPHEILLVLKERHTPPHTNLWAGGKIILKGRAVDGKKYFNATLLFQPPGRMRLRGSRMITSTLFEFIINDDHVALVFNKEKKWFEGTLAELKKHPEAMLGLDPIQLPEALMIQQDFIRLLEDGRFEKWKRGKEHYLFIKSGDDGFREVFLIEKKHLLVREAGLYGPDGGLVLRLHYRRYAFFDGKVLPAELDMYFPKTDMKARIRIREYKHPERFHALVFDTTPQRGYTGHPLGQLFQSTDAQ